MTKTRAPGFTDPMTFQSKITRGKAFFKDGGLRCANPRSYEVEKPCNKLLAKRNALGQVAGSFKCDRCRAEVEVEISAST
jgi:phage FluMu protein Com